MDPLFLTDPQPTSLLGMDTHLNRSLQDKYFNPTNNPGKKGGALITKANPIFIITNHFYQKEGEQPLMKGLGN